MIQKNEKDEIAKYLVDESNFKGYCDRVYLVENKQDVIDILISANNSKIPVTIAGNNTSLTGSSVPQGGWVVSSERLNKIINFDVLGQTVTVEPGITLKELQLFLKQKNLYFPPDPTETSCSIGGMIGTNASGARSFKYGAVKNFVEEIEIVIADGSIVKFKREDKLHEKNFSLFIDEHRKFNFDVPDDYILPDIKNNVGYNIKSKGDMIDLFIGAEGTLGFVTAVKLKVLSVPYDVISFVIFISDIDTAFVFLNELRTISKLNNHNNCTNKIAARLIEFFDEKALSMLRAKFFDIPNDAKAAFWIEQEIYDEQHQLDSLQLWEEFFNSKKLSLNNIWLGLDETDKAKIINFRHSLPILVNDLIRSRGLKKLGTDISVPDFEFENYYKWVVTAVEAKNVDYVIFGHFGDSHMHLNLLPANTDEMVTCKDLYNYICSEAIVRGGTFSAEHGVGKIKKHYLKSMYKPSDISFMKKIKFMFDPNNILSSENLF